MPADADALADFPSGNPLPDRIHDSDDFMAGNTRILHTRPGPFFGERVAVTNATSLNFDPHPAGPGSGISRSTISNGPFGCGTCTARIFFAISF